MLSKKLLYWVVHIREEEAEEETSHDVSRHMKSSEVFSQTTNIQETENEKKNPKTELKFKETVS